MMKRMKHILSAALLLMPLMVVAQSETETELTMQKEVLGDSIKNGARN